MPQAVRDTITQADLIVGLGIRFGEMTTAGWTLIDLDEPTQRIVHIHPERTQLGRIYPTDVGVCSDPSVTIGALQEMSVPTSEPRRRGVRRRAAFVDGSRIAAAGPTRHGRSHAMAVTNAPADVIFTNGAGNFSVWNNKGFRYGSGLDCWRHRTARWATASQLRSRESRPPRPDHGVFRR